MTGYFTENTPQFYHNEDIYVQGLINGGACAGGFAGYGDQIAYLNIKNGYINTDVKAIRSGGLYSCVHPYTGSEINKVTSDGLRLFGTIEATGVYGYQLAIYGYSTVLNNTYYNAEIDSEKAQDSQGDKDSYRPSEFFETKAGYAGWDFDTIWDLDPTKNGGYPTLQWAK